MNMTPIAQSLAAQGRNGDSMLVHMTPNEVGGLQALAQSAGGSLSINPATGMPEANFLKSILPMVIGLGITAATGGAAAPWMIGAGVGGGTALLTGDLNKGLMAGLGAFGGAGIGTTLAGLGGAAQAGAGASGAALIEGGTSGILGGAMEAGSLAAPGAVSSNLLGAGAQQAMANPGAFGSSLVSNLGGPLGAGAAGLGVLGSLGASDQSSIVEPTTSADSTYEGPYMPVEREVRYPDVGRTSTSEFDYFNPSNPTPGFQTFADGGEIDFNLQPVPAPEPTPEVKPTGDPTGDPMAQMLFDFLAPGFREAFSGETYVDPEERARIQQVLKSEGYIKGDSGGSGGSTVIESAPAQMPRASGFLNANIIKAVRDASGRRKPSTPPPIDIDSKYGFQSFAPGGMVQGFQTFGGQQATNNMYAFNPDSSKFRNEAEKLRILGRQTGAGIPMNISGINMEGEPIYETSYNIPGITEDDISAVRDGLGITNIRGDLESIRKDLANAPAPLTFKDMTDNDMRYLKSVLDINPSPETVVNPPTPSPSTPTFTPRPDAPVVPSAVAPPPPPPPTPTPAALPPPTPEAPPEVKPTGDPTGDPMAQMLFDFLAPGFKEAFSGETYVDPNEQGAATGGVIRKAPGGLASIASGGEFMEDGSFVFSAREVAELGNGSSNAGLELLMQLGGRPVEGPGDGVSDSVPATIDGTQDAAVARDEVIFDPEAVARIGNGDPETGKKRLYAMMRQAEKSRKEADRGEDSGAGLKALSMAGVV